MIKPSVIVLFLLLFVYSNVFSFQFEDYSWGEPLDQVMKKLEKNKKRFSYSGYGLTYSDKILGRPCEVYFAFTAKSKELAFVSLSWDTASVGGELKGLLTEKYGTAYPFLTNIYFWLGQSQTAQDSIYLNYSSDGTRLFYYGGEYYGKYVQERR